MTSDNFIIPFYDFDISVEDEKYIFSLLKAHNTANVLNYHGYLSPRLTFKTQFSNNLKQLADKLNLRLAGIYAFTAHANTTTSIHIDGDESLGPLPWRLCWYCQGGAGTLEWYEKDIANTFDNKVGAYVCADNSLPVFSQTLDMRSAFIRTNYPHRLDLNNTQMDRLTITASFKPYITWEELQLRLGYVKNTN